MISYWLECRRRMLQIFIGYAILFVVFFLKSSTVFHWIVLPILQTLNIKDSLIATQITTPIVVPITLAADLAGLSIAPFVLLQIWLFISPALHVYERKQIRCLMITSLLLFGSGLVFCFYLVLPYMFAFFATAIPAGVRLMPDMGFAVDFIMRMLLIFGVCFQIPLVCMLLVHFKWFDIAKLKLVRPYIIVLAFIIGMILTPPDVLSQIMLAVPLCLLYEFGIFLGRVAIRLRKSS